MAAFRTAADKYASIGSAIAFLRSRAIAVNSGDEFSAKIERFGRRRIRRRWRHRHG